MSEQRLPTADEFFGPSGTIGQGIAAQEQVQQPSPATPTGPQQKEKLPTADEFFAPSAMETTWEAVKQAPSEIGGMMKAAWEDRDMPASSPQMDDFFSKTAFGRILRSFGQGIENGWGDGPLEFAPETQKWLQSVGIYNDVKGGQQTLIKSFNEAMMRPAVTVLGTSAEALVRGINAAYTGAQGAIIGVGEEVGQKQLARDLATMPDAFMGAPGAAHPSLPVAALPKARSLAIIGEGEAGWKGTRIAEDPKVAQQRYIDAYREWEDMREAEPPSATGPQGGPQAPDGAMAAAEAANPTPPAQPDIPDVHQMARQLAPAVFDQYDALQARSETFRQWIADLDEQRRTEATADLDRQIGALQGQLDGASARNAKRYQKQIEDLQAERQKALDAIHGDSPDMARIRQQLQDTDYEMRDLAPEVSRAYRDAREALPEEARPPEAVPETEGQGLTVGSAEEPTPEGAPEAPQAVPEQPPGPPAPQGELPLERPPAPKAPRPGERLPEVANENRVPDIQADVREKLTAAGRPPEEADAAAAIVASHYEARAKRLGTTADDLYADETVNVRKQGQPAQQRVTDYVQKKRKGEGTEFEQNDVRNIDTPEFKNWFGESKILDKKKEPLIVYHGSSADIEQFLKPTDEIKNQGFYFTPDASLANRYAFRRQGEGAPNVSPVYLSIKNPKIINEHTFWEKFKARREGRIWPRTNTESAFVTKEQIAEYKRQGYDGLVNKQLNEIVAFDANQIKSVFNRGTFDPNDARILHQPAKGKIRLFDDGSHIITLMKNADASTFMHETGHLWLDELMRDAKLDAAVQSLKDDAAAVRKWLGAAEEADLTTAQHEKFARGFERYLMEGRAPTKELASVFRQFKEWLTKIYETVARLRSPINDNIRGVFDRLIATEGERPIIAEDMKRKPNFAEAHEAEAKGASVADATNIADRIEAESDAIAQRLLEDYDDLFPGQRKPEPAGQSAGGGAGEIPPSPETIPDRGNAPGPIGGPDGAAAESGAVGPGGGGSPAEGAARAAGEQRRAEAEREPVSANDPLPPPETRFIDKAGNIRIDNLNVPEDVGDAIRAAADAGNEFMAARRGRMSDAQALELADALGMSPETLNLRQIGEAFNAEQIWAARKLLVRSATEVRDAMAKAAAGTDADVMAYAQVKARHQMIQEQVAGITAEAGRALRAFRSFEGVKEAEQITEFLQQQTGRTLNQLRREAQMGAELDTPGQVSKFINDSKRATFKDMAIEFWINALLSGPTTHVKNIIGNMAVAVNKVVETGIAGTIGEARRRVGVGPEGGVEISEVKGALYGTLQGAKEGVIAAAKAFKTEEIPVSGTIEQKKYKAIPSYKFSAAGRELEVGGRQIRIPGRALSAEDAFFRAIAHRQELNILAYREATQAGLEGDAFKQRIADIVTNPSDAQMEAARKAAEYQTFVRQLGPTGLRLQQFANSHPLLKVVIPFVRTPTNILKYAFERTPFGLLSSEIRNNLAGRNGAAAMDTQYARLVMGGMVTTAFVGLAMEGLATGNGPDDPRQRAMMRADGWQPYSLKIGDTYVAYDWLDPFATIMGITSDVTSAIQTAQADDAEIGKTLSMTVASLSKNIMSKLSLRGASDLINAVTDPDRYGPHYIQNLSGTIVPNVFAQIARAQDPVIRDARTFADAIKVRIPGLRETVLPRRDVWGEEITSEGAIGPDFGSPLYFSTESGDPVNQRLIALQVWPSKPQRQIRGVELTDQQYDDYSRVAGRLAKMRLDAVMANPQFAMAPDFVQRDMIGKIITNSRESAASLVMMQNPGIIQAAIDDKVRSLQPNAKPRKGKIQQAQ